MEERSIYEFIQENMNFNGKISADCKLSDYLKRVYGKEYNYDEGKIYNHTIPREFNFPFEDAAIQRVEFRLYTLVDKMLKSLNSDELEEHFINNDMIVRKNIDKIIDVIEKNIENIDKEKLSEFCKENILKTKNMYCMYIYLLLISYTDLKDKERLQNIILKVGLLSEYTNFINDYVLDKFLYPDYSRFYLVKRVVEEKDIGKLLDKISFESDQIKNWVLINYTSRFSDEFIVKSVEKLELLKILKKWDLDAKRYHAIGETLSYFLSNSYLYDNIDHFENILLEYISLYEKFCVNVEVFEVTTQIHEKLIRIKELSVGTQRSLEAKYKEVLTGDTTVNLIKSLLAKPYLDKWYRNKLFNVISMLNISEFYLKIFNVYKENPVENCNLVTVFNNSPELFEKAVNLLEKQINWDDVIGEYNNVDVGWQPNDIVQSLIIYVADFPEIAMSIYAKTLKSKTLNHRRDTLFYIRCWEYKNNIYYRNLSDELKESIKYVLKNELNALVISEAQGITGIESEVTYGYNMENSLRRTSIASKFNFVGKNDEKIRAELEEKMEELENKNRVINLKSYIFGKLDIDESLEGLNLIECGKLMYVEQLNGETFGCCQGDEFGKEYIVILKSDEENNLKEEICSCGNCKKERFCKHVSAVLIYLSKMNDKEAEEKKKEK